MMCDGWRSGPRSICGAILVATRVLCGGHEDEPLLLSSDRGPKVKAKQQTDVLQEKVWPQPSQERCSTPSPLLNYARLQKSPSTHPRDQEGQWGGWPSRAKWKEAYFKGIS